MSLARIRKPTLIVLSLLLALLVLSFAPQTQPAALTQGSNAIALRAPSFVQVANAQDAPDAAPMGFPQDEAGISAYFKSASPVTLADVRSVFRVIEVETADYIIGSVPVTNYPESEDVHVYVHRDGWFLAYYLSADPAGKIFNWRKFHSTGRVSITTKLEDTLAVVTSQAGVPFTISNTTYYDFRYPNANRLMFVVEWTTNWDSFEINLPGTFAYNERSWSFDTDQDASFGLDGTTIASFWGWGNRQGVFPAAQMLPDQFHTIFVDAHGDDNSAYCGLALVYRMP